MSEHEQIVSTIALIQDIIDDKRWDELEQVYTEAGTFVLSSGRSYEGLENIRELMLTFEHPVVHYTTNELVTIDASGNRAHVKSKVLGILLNGDFMIGTYNDELEKSDRWRVSKRVCGLRAKWSGNSPVVVAD